MLFRVSLYKLGRGKAMKKLVEATMLRTILLKENKKRPNRIEIWPAN